MPMYLIEKKNRTYFFTKKQFAIFFHFGCILFWKILTFKINFKPSPVHFEKKKEKFLNFFYDFGRSYKLQMFKLCINDFVNLERDEGKFVFFEFS